MFESMPTKSSSRRRRNFWLERLEDRAMMAGNVSAWVSGGTLYVRGDSAANGVEIRQLSSTTFSVLGTPAPGYTGSQDRTRINGTSGAKVFSGVYDDLDIEMGAGSDGVSLSGNSRSFPMVLPDDLRFSGGTGNDGLSMSHVRNRDYNDVMSINLGSGADSVSLFFVNSRMGLSIYGQDGNDSVSLTSVSSDRIYVDMGSGNDWLTWQQISSVYLTLAGGSGSDTLKGSRFTQTSRQYYVGFERLIDTTQFF